jgi:pyruvate/2-oxoglutarate dehydrogenase complex dihydrolipoamide acyltransferase (E2) component
VGGDVTTSRKRSSTPLPDDFEPNDTNRRLAAERGLDLAAVVEHWRDYHLAKDSRFVDWHRALNTWLRNETPKATSTPAPARLTPVAELETPPDGLSDVEYDAWLRRRRA